MRKYTITLELNGTSKTVEIDKCKDIFEAVDRFKYDVNQFNWEIIKIEKNGRIN
jgi:hypothetical protein